MRLTPQQKKVIGYLSDGDWHCMANHDFFMKDDRKRISELNNLGYKIEGKPCDGRCGIRHSARLLMRRINKKPKPVTFSFVERNGIMVAIQNRHE